MKNSFFLIAFAAIVFSGCGGNTNDHTHDGDDAHQHTTGTHTHDDGTTHEDHPEMHQEEFNVNSTDMQNDSALHHHNGEPHTH
jgi:hypothetical protein